MGLLSSCLTSVEARWPIRDGDRVGRGWESERLNRGNCPEKTGETVDRRQNNGSVKAVSPRHCPATCALCNCCFNCCAGQSLRHCPLHRCWRTTWTTWSKKMSNLLSPAPPPYSWSLQGKVEGPAPPPSSKISWSFDLAWNPEILQSVKLKLSLKIQLFWLVCLKGDHIRQGLLSFCLQLQTTTKGKDGVCIHVYAFVFLSPGINHNKKQRWVCIGLNKNLFETK